MNHLAGSPVAILIFMVCAVALLSLLKNTLGLGGPPAPVAKRFMTDRELAMLAAIERVLPAHRIHAQVAMGALLQVPRRLGRRASYADRNSFSQKIVDFVVQDRNSGAIVALIEIDDYSHNVARDAKRDAMTARAVCSAASLASSASTCSLSTTNSSPPMRATRSASRTQPTTRSAKLRITRSPAAWP